MAAEGRPGTLIEPVARNRAVLGKGVHIGALMRLHELWPNVVARVEHGSVEIPLPPGELKMDGPRFRRQRQTTVSFDLDGEGNVVAGVATCHPADNFDRRKGIELAFRRAMARARREAALRDAGYVRITVGHHKAVEA